MSDVIDLASVRQRRGLKIERQSVDELRAAFGVPRALPALPHPGKSKGDFVRLADGSTGWISEHRFTSAGRLVLTVRVRGIAVTVMADDVTPDGAA